MISDILQLGGAFAAFSAGGVAVVKALQMGQQLVKPANGNGHMAQHEGERWGEMLTMMREEAAFRKELSAGLAKLNETMMGVGATLAAFATKQQEHIIKMDEMASIVGGCEVAIASRKRKTRKRVP